MFFVGSIQKLPHFGYIKENRILSKVIILIELSKTN